MIRSLTPQDLNTVMQIWLEGNLEAHAFIPEAYWKSNVPLVRDQLQSAEVWVYEKNGALLGFAGMQGWNLCKKRGAFHGNRARAFNSSERTPSSSDPACL